MKFYIRNLSLIWSLSPRTSTKYNIVAYFTNKFVYIKSSSFRCCVPLYPAILHFIISKFSASLRASNFEVNQNLSQDDKSRDIHWRSSTQWLFLWNSQWVANPLTMVYEEITYHRLTENIPKANRRYSTTPASSDI